jgi:hypothetical protein
MLQFLFAFHSKGAYTAVGFPMCCLRREGNKGESWLQRDKAGMVPAPVEDRIFKIDLLFTNISDEQFL